MIGSFAALLIVLEFVLPGYITRWVASRRFYMRAPGDFELLFQSVLISGMLVVAWSIPTTLIPWPFLSQFSPYHLLISTQSKAPQVGWQALITLLVIIGLGVALVASRKPDLIRWIGTFNKVQQYPLWYHLFYVHQLENGNAGDAPWALVELDDRSIVTGRVYEYGLESPDEGSLVLTMAGMQDTPDDERSLDEFWYIPARSIRILRVRYVKVPSEKSVDQKDEPVLPNG